MVNLRLYKEKLAEKEAQVDRPKTKMNYDEL